MADTTRADWTKLGIDIDLVIRRYQEWATCTDIGKEIGWSAETVRRCLKRAGVSRREQGAAGLPPERNQFYKRGHTISASGYRKILRRDGTRGYDWEHRIVMSEHLGRPLLRSEVVHHKNGDKLDNRIENLEIFEKNSDHLRHELTGRCPKWTEDGKRRIQAGIEKSRIVRAEAKRLQQTKSDASQ